MKPKRLPRIRNALRTAVFVSNVLPALPALRLNPWAKLPVREELRIPGPYGELDAERYLPGWSGPHPAVTVCLGVVPAGREHPQVRRLGEAFARAGTAALLVWSPAMRDLRLDPRDVGGLAAAHKWLRTRPEIDPARCGLIGTCVGGSIALLAAARPEIRDDVVLVGAFAPYGSLWTLAAQIASGSRPGPTGEELWAVDPLTRQVFERTLLTRLPDELAARLTAVGSSAAADAVLAEFPTELREEIDVLSPEQWIDELRAPRIVIAHDRDDPVIPIGQSRALIAALGGRPGVTYREFTMFKHLDPSTVHLGRIALIRELLRFARTLSPIVSLPAQSALD